MRAAYLSRTQHSRSTCSRASAFQTARCSRRAESLSAFAFHATCAVQVIPFYYHISEIVVDDLSATHPDQILPTVAFLVRSAQLSSAHLISAQLSSGY